MTTEQRSFARALRKQQTRPEELLWQQLRGRRCAGFKFRRQVPLSHYTVDFICLTAKLIVELDGRQHGWEVEFDARRTEELDAMGFAVLRFSNAQVDQDLDQVRARIVHALQPAPRSIVDSATLTPEAPPPTLSRSGEG